MKNLSDEELVRKYIISHINCFVKNLPAHHQWCKERDSLKSEILSRLAEARKEIERLKEQNDKFMWQVRDTCQRAEKAEAENAALRERLQGIEDMVIWIANKK